MRSMHTPSATDGPRLDTISSYGTSVYVDVGCLCKLYHVVQSCRLDMVMLA
jgi:hypothetical protein